MPTSDYILTRTDTNGGDATCHILRRTGDLSFRWVAVAADEKEARHVIEGLDLASAAADERRERDRRAAEFTAVAVPAATAPVPASGPPIYPHLADGHIAGTDGAPDDATIAAHISPPAGTEVDLGPDRRVGRRAAAR